MVSKKFMVYAKFFGVGLLFLLSLLPLQAKTKLSDRFVVQQREREQLYFIVPYEIHSCAKSLKPLEADITYITSSDSVSMKTSVRYPEQMYIDSVVFVSGETRNSLKFQTCFIDSEGKFFHHRIFIDMQYQYLKSIYSADKAFEIIIYSSDRQLCYSVPAKKWESEKGWMCQILRLIDNNKRLMETRL